MDVRLSTSLLAASGLPGLPAEQLVQALAMMSQWSTLAIFGLFGLHLVLFLFLWNWYRRDVRNIASALDGFTREVKFRSVLDRNSHLCDQIEAFLSDINEVLERPDRKADRLALSQRIHILDEKRTYLQSMGFETTYNIARSGIEIYPLLGILGTIMAIGVVVQGPAPGAGAVQALVQRFGEAIWSTFAGLVAALILILVNSALESSFVRLSEDRRLVRDTVLKVKRTLALPVSEVTPA